tara:strand:+ start:239 stop:466 length:228 start_codon:yes stop_codon:yes gene_type:complete
MNKQQLIDRINEDDKLAEQVHKILNALDTAALCGKCIISPQSEDAPIVIISFEPQLKRMIESQLEGHGVKPSWKQ